MILEHSEYMKIALLEARNALEVGEVPVGAVIVLKNKIIGTGHNLSITHNDPTLHAEIVAIRNACKKIRNYRLTGASIYVTLEPCTMCFGAIIHSRVSNIFFGANDKKSGVCGSCEDLNQKKYFNHKPSITGQIMTKECSKILKDFFIAKRV